MIKVQLHQLFDSRCLGNTEQPCFSSLRQQSRLAPELTAV